MKKFILAIITALYISSFAGTVAASTSLITTKSSYDQVAAVYLDVGNRYRGYDYYYGSPYYYRDSSPYYYYSPGYYHDPYYGGSGIYWGW